MAQPRRLGFTLIELMTVVATIGILASIAIPNYLLYMYRARTAEPLINVPALAYLEQVQILEMGQPLVCAPSPSAIPAKEKVWFEPSDAWRELGFQPEGRVRFQYEVQSEPDGEFVVFARGDLDGDGTSSEFRMSSRDMELTAVRRLE